MFFKKAAKPDDGSKKVKKRPVRNALKSMFRVNRWVAARDIITYGKFIHATAKEIFSKEEGQQKETFIEAVLRLNLTPEKLKLQAKKYLILAGAYSVIALGLCIYSLYHLFHQHFLAAWVSFAIMVMLLAHTLRAHFWYMQIKKEQLGCSFKDWLLFILPPLKLFGAKK